MKKEIRKGILLALLAAALFALNSPFSKLLLDVMPPTMMAGFLYLGAGLGIGLVALAEKWSGNVSKEAPVTKKELPYTLAMILLDIAAPICLLFGLRHTSAAGASLLNNFEIVATALIALLLFRERISPRLWLGIGTVTLSCLLLSLDDWIGATFSPGSLLILAACVFWGLENNCTRALSEKNPLQVVLLKGLFSGIGSLVIAFAAGERTEALWSIPPVLLLGFVSYGLSIYCYVYAQRFLGAARTSAYYAIAPFIGTFLSLILFRALPSRFYFAALLLMILGAFLCADDKPLRQNKRK